MIIYFLVIHPGAVAKSELWVDVERVAASAPEWYAQSLKVKHSEACPPCALTIVALPNRPDMEALLREVATLRAKGDAMLPVNAATATIAFGRAAQALCSLRSMLLSSLSGHDDRDKALARLNDEVAELVLLAKSRFLTFSKKSAFILFAKDSHTASRDDFFNDDGLLKWDAFVAPLVHMDQGEHRLLPHHIHVRYGSGLTGLTPLTNFTSSTRRRVRGPIAGGDRR